MRRRTDVHICHRSPKKTGTRANPPGSGQCIVLQGLVLLKDADSGVSDAVVGLLNTYRLVSFRDVNFEHE